MPSLSDLHASLGNEEKINMSMNSRPLQREREAEPQIFEIPAELQEAEALGGTPLSDPRRFAEEQMRCLVRQIFCPGWPRPAKQVVIAAVDDDTDIANICLQAGQALSEQVEASICVVEADFRNGLTGAPSGTQAFDPDGFGSMRNHSHQVSTNLWQVPSHVFLGEQNGLSSAWLQGRLAELRLEFDYTVLHSPPAGVYGEAALLGHLCDGVVLVLEANSTRRVVAQRAKEKLQAANARVLGAVLNDRVFPIPDGIYKRL